MEKFISWHSRKHCFYDDGEILGSLIGRIDIETMKIDFTKISPTNKFEGLTLFSKQEPNPVSDFVRTIIQISRNIIYKLSIDLK
jgi:hypothetical protein